MSYSDAEIASRRAGLVARIRRLMAGRMARAAAVTYGFSFATLITNLASGIITARALAPAGRGQAVAIAMLAQNIGLVFACGCSQAISYSAARDHEAARRLAATWSLLLIPLAALGVGLGELSLPLFFHAQSAHAIFLARLYLPMIALVVVSEMTAGLLLGTGQYGFFNFVRFAQPATYTLILIVVAIVGHLTVGWTLAVGGATGAATQVIAMRRALRGAGGFGPLDLKLGRSTLWYGLRGHGVTLAGAMNQRLDVVIMPAFISAASIGLYSVAANISLIVSALANQFSNVVLPAAVRDGDRGPQTVIRSVQVSGSVAALLAGGLIAFASPALSLVYGSKFLGAATSLRILAGGTVLLAVAYVLIAGLYAANRPTLATLTQVAGLIVTVAGLSIFLRHGGILAAAIVSTAAYSLVFVVALIAFKRVTAVRWSDFVPRRSKTDGG